MNVPAKISSKSYYPFGMVIPGRSFSTTAYKWGYNTQEKCDEISGAGNHTTAKFWEYDTRLGWRWNQDPRPNPSLSNYATNANNPIWNRDVLGDTTAVYNSKGTYLNTLNDKNPFQVLVVNSKYDKVFEKWKGATLKQNEANATYNKIAKYGITYDIGSARAFYNKWGKAFPIKKIGGVSLEGKKVLMNGRPLIQKLYAESILYLTVKNNRVTVPTTKPQSDGDLLENDANRSHKIHPHPNLGKGAIFDIEDRFHTWKRNVPSSTGGPSGNAVNGEDGDYEMVGGDRSLEQRDIVVDKSNIYLYNSIKDQTIAIPR